MSFYHHYLLSSSSSASLGSTTTTTTTTEALRETQTLRAGCSKAEPKNFALPRTPFPEARDGQNYISWRCHYLYLQTQFGEDRYTKFRVIVVTELPTNAQTHRYTDRTDYNTLRRSLARSVTTYISSALLHHDRTCGALDSEMK